jgi:peptidoglycan L-alanyl-D-glutamate endopeptidase CwlK
VIVLFWLIVDYFSVSKENRRKNAELDIRIRPHVRAFIREAARNGIHLRITEAYRSFARQQALYNQGRTTPGQIVTNAKPGYSYHNFRLAFDVVDIQKGYSGSNWTLIGKIGKKHGFEWGGDWKNFVDKPHFQKTFGKTTVELREKYL